MSFYEVLARYVLFEGRGLRNKRGQRVKVLDQGNPISLASFEFEQAKIESEGIIWVGKVVVLNCASEWNLKKHYQNNSYNNVVLVVAARDDLEIYTRKERQLNVVSLGEMAIE